MKAKASENTKPDKVEIVEIEEKKELIEGYEEYRVNSTIWDMTKDIQLTYGNLCFHAFLSKDGKSSWIYKVNQSESQELSQLKFPETVQNAPVRKIGPARNLLNDDIMVDIWGNGIEPYHECDNYESMPAGIKSVQLPSTVTDIVYGSFCGFQNLTSIKIPDGVTYIGNATFYHCYHLKKVVFPTNLETFDFSAFEGCKMLSTIQISKSSKNYKCQNGMMFSKNGKTLVWIVPNAKKITIPEGVKTIGQGASIYSNVTSIFIPKSVTTIRRMSLNGDKLTDITISSKNKTFAKAGDCIYNKQTKHLVVAISKKGSITLPKQVQYLDNNLSVAGKNIKN